MQKKYLYRFLLVMSVGAMVPYSVHGQEQQLQINISALETQVEQLVTDISKKEEQVTQFQTDIQRLMQQKSETASKINELTDVVKVRKQQARQRLIALQTGDVFRNFVDILLNSESIVDFIERFTIISELQKASNDKIIGANQAVNTLKELKVQQDNHIKSLETAQFNLKQETELLKGQQHALKSLVENNREQLVELAKKKYEEQQRLAQALQLPPAQQPVANVVQVSSSDQRQDETSQTNRTSEQAVQSMSTSVAQTTAKQIEQPDTQGNTNQQPFDVVATAYSYKEPGLTPYTAMGIDLRVNPQVIAVDPRVIPLGSLVHVHGYGVYLAADTGGAIKGHKIDVHMTDLDAVTRFGRRTVKVTILNR